MLMDKLTNFQFFFLIILFPISSFSQLQKHTLSASGDSYIGNDVIITYSVSQQSSASMSNPNFPIILGFQSPYWSNLIDDSQVYSAILYPNPFHEKVTLFSEMNTDEDFEVFVFDISGRLVFQTNARLFDNRLNLNLSKLPAGAYLFRVKNEKETFYKKLIKK